MKPRLVPTAILASVLVSNGATPASAAPLSEDAPIITAPPRFEEPPQAQTPAQVQAQPLQNPPPGAAQSAAQTAAQTAASPAAVVRPDINPYNRDITLTAPLTFNRRPLGEVPVTLTRDDRFIVDSAGFLELITPLLTDEAAAALTARLAGQQGFEGEELAAQGVSLEYDPTALSLLVVRIAPNLRRLEVLFERGGPEAEGLAPLPFSAFLNAATSWSYRHATGDAPAPNVYLNGAGRWRGLVLEAEVQGRETLGSGDYEWLRRYARFVYDQPQEYRRWTVGDLNPEFRGLQGYADVGGVGVTRQRRRFDPYRPNVFRQDRQLLLQSESTVRILRNGALVRELRLDPGQYDLSNLPVQTGSNDLEVVVVDGSGASQSYRYSAYIDSIDLDPGEYEYGGYLGVAGRPSFGQPDYSDGDIAFTGYWRKAFIDKPALGVGLQASERVQMANAQTQFILRNGSRLNFQVGASNSDTAGGGYALVAAYDFYIDRPTTSDFFTVQFEHVSEGFATLSDPDASNPIAWQAYGQYSRVFSDRLYGSVGLAYNKSRDSAGLGDSFRSDLTANYAINRQWSAQAGVNYLKYEDTPGGRRDRDGWGFTFALTWRPSSDVRADARYDSNLNSASASFYKIPENLAGSIGYSAIATYDDGPASLLGGVDYVGNRFNASISHAGYGQDFGSISDQQVTTASVSTAIAFAGGKAAIGRRVADSFAILYGHPSLEDRPVIAGEVLRDGRYSAASGPLGPVLYPYLGSYVNDSVYYDVIDVPAGYDIGEGVRRVRPAYRSGYAFEIGSDAFVSAVGSVTGRGAAGPAPLSLIGGRVIALDEPDAASQPFFTNSVGRFAVQGLKPGGRYRVELFTDPRGGFYFTVPADNDGLYNLRFVHVYIAAPE